MVAGVIAAVGGIAIAARDAKDEGKAAAPPAGAPMAPQVPVAEVITRTVAPSAEYTGFLAAPKTVELRSRVGGAVDAVSVPEGSLVRKGQLLFQIDPAPFFAWTRQIEIRADKGGTAKGRQDATGFWRLTCNKGRLDRSPRLFRFRPLFRQLASKRPD